MANLLLWTILLFSTQTLAFEHWHIGLEPSFKTVFAYNRTSQPQTLWISGPINYLPQNPDDKLEQALTVEAFGSLEIPLVDFKQHPWLHLKTDHPQSLQITVSDITGLETLINPGSSQRWKARAIAGADLLLLNLAPFKQKLRLFDSSSSTSHILEISLEGFGKTRLSLPPWAQSGTLFIEGEARIQGFLIGDKKSQSFYPSVESSTLSPSSSKVYFKLSNRDNNQNYTGQSFTVGLDDTEMIAQAREQIKQPLSAPGPWLPRILVAEIDYGSGQENRDWSKPGFPLWSWHISRAFRFAQLAHQDCDGSPEMLEELLKPWKEGPGIICFWNYRVTEELTIEQVAKPSTRLPVLGFPQPSLEFF